MTRRTLGATLIALAFVLLAFGCASSYPVTPSAHKAHKAQQSRMQSQFP